jgi:hypothetical protein
MMRGATIRSQSSCRLHLLRWGERPICADHCEILDVIAIHWLWLGRVRSPGRRLATWSGLRDSERCHDSSTAFAIDVLQRACFDALH